MVQTYTVMSFNLRVIVPSDPFNWEERKHWMAETIQTYMPDIIGTQEATIPMLEWLKDTFKDSYEIYAVNRTDSNEVGEFCAVFVKKSSFTIGSKGSFMLSETPDIIGSMGWDAHCERICSWVELIPKGKTDPVLRFFNTHLDHMGKLARKEGLRLVKHVMNNEKSLPVILTGDFNDVPDSEALREMSSMKSCYSCFTAEEMKNSLTFHAYEGGTEGAPIDYILSSHGVEILSTSIIRDRIKGGFPSDHYPVLATIELKGENQ